MPLTRLRKVISGGQTGVDIAALRAAKDAGLETGGSIPRGFLTENGNEPSRKQYGMEETLATSYVPRTEANVKDSDATLWYGDLNSRGGQLTLKMCNKHGKAFITITEFVSEDIFNLINRCGWEVINVAGNRESKAPGIEKKAYDLLFPVFCGGDHEAEIKASKARLYANLDTELSGFDDAVVIAVLERILQEKKEEATDKEFDHENPDY